MELHHCYNASKKECRAVEQYILAGPALVQIRPLFTVSKRELRSLFFLPDKHVVLVGELKMPACGLCMGAYKKGSSGSKKPYVCISLSPNFIPVSFCPTFSNFLSPNLSESFLCEDVNPDSHSS